MYATILWSRDGQVATLTLNRPDRLNAIGREMRDEILDAVEGLRQEPAVRVLIITGAGRGFSAGGDITYLKQLREARDAAGFQAMLTKGQQITRTLRALPIPVIAAVNGPCAGAGLALALACDMRFASDQATFGPTFARIGLHPDWGSSWFLPRLVGSARACELIFRGDMITASEAAEIGLVNRVTPADTLMSLVHETASRMARNPAGVLRLAKESIYRSLNSDLETAFARENAVQAECFESDDFLEGIRAFLEKRKPQFRGSV